MTNDEIGTYQIAEAIRANPKLRVVEKDGRWECEINQIRYIGNVSVLTKSIDCSKVKVLKNIKNNKIDFIQDSIEVLHSIYGVEYEKDWELIFDPEEVWSKSRSKATKKEVLNKSTFSLDDDDGTSIM